MTNDQPMRRLLSVGLFAGVGVLPLSCGSTPTNPTPEGSCPAAVAAELSTKSRLPRSSQQGSAQVLAFQRQPAPRADVPVYSGSWKGKYRVVGCGRSCGLGPNICDGDLVPPGATFGLALRIVQDGSAASGTLDLMDNFADQTVETGAVAGSIGDSGALTLYGNTYTVDPKEPSRSVITGWESSLSADRVLMAGRFKRNRTFQNFWGAQQIHQDCELVDFRRTGS